MRGFFSLCIDILQKNLYVQPAFDHRSKPPLWRPPTILRGPTLSDTPVPSHRSPAIFGTVPHPDGVTVRIEVSCQHGHRWMSVASEPEHPDGMFDRFITHFTQELLATIPLGVYIFTATIMPDSCLILQWPDSDVAEQKAIWLRHRVRNKMHELARHLVSERERGGTVTPFVRSGRSLHLTLLPGGKDDNT